MGKNIFERIAGWINGQEDNGLAEKTGQPVAAKADMDESSKSVKGESNAIEKRENLIKSVKDTLNANYRGQKCSFEDKVLSVCIMDNLFYDSLDKDDFERQLQTVVYDELGYAFAKVETISGPLHEDESYSKVSDSVFLQVNPVKKALVVRKAIIMPVEGCGSTVSESYVLDSEEISGNPGARYNIGAGKHPMMADSSHRKNYIAIDDDPFSPDFAKNRYVSRSHAYITYGENAGFMLHAELGGTRLAGKRTHIYRDSEKIELDNTLISEPLRDGDYIVLSKYVHLLFKEM
ncbi:MAG: hypothetical protein NC115_08800 [Bacteroidales bacterium]|nr:hypothetical protein [Bacteroides sp.]MCM1502745.1 hypothetical protein [Bacteroidales bacterium]